MANAFRGYTGLASVDEFGEPLPIALRGLESLPDTPVTGCWQLYGLFHEGGAVRVWSCRPTCGGRRHLLTRVAWNLNPPLVGAGQTRSAAHRLGAYEAVEASLQRYHQLEGSTYSQARCTRRDCTNNSARQS